MLLDTAAAAIRCQLARSTLAKMRWRGDGPPFIKLGAKVLYDESDLVAWIASHERKTNTAEGSVTKSLQPK